jgi:hypothetical protein
LKIEEKQMHNTLLKRFLNSWSDNRKSKTCPELGRRIQNRKLVGVLAIFVLLLGCVGVATAQEPKKVPRIGYLSAADAATDSVRTEGIRLALRERGHIEGQNIATEDRFAEGKADRAPELAAELVRLKVDIIVVSGGDAWIRAAKDATKTIPIVMNDEPKTGCATRLNFPLLRAKNAVA